MNLFKKTKKIKITDDDGIIAIVNIEKYNNTLNFQENWTWRQLNDFLLNKNNENIIVFGTGCEEEWTLEFLINEEYKKTHFRKFEQNIEITDENLHIISWSDLTSTLQFTDSKLPNYSNKDLKLKIENGHYKVVVKQRFSTRKIMNIIQKLK